MTRVVVDCDVNSCSWSIECDEWEADKRKQAHTATRHTSPDAITALLAADPSNEEGKRAIVAAIEVVARANSGRVSANGVRPLLPQWVQPQLVGAVFQALRKTGRLWVTDEEEPNTDLRGRNTNKVCPVYVMREAS